MSYKKDWSEYYKLTQAKPPRELLVNALEYVENKGKAIDIGGGALRDTRYLLEQVFDVTVIDKSPLMEAEAKNIQSDTLHCFTTAFEEFAFPNDTYDLASAMYSLPFCDPNHFDRVLKDIFKSIKSGGIFCGQFFGERDEWSSDPKMTFLNKDQAMKALADFNVILFKEEEKDDKTAKGEMKHWHVFHFIVRKKI